jgi:hypothetical protein
VVPGPPASVDGRELRAAQGVVAVILLGAFVFRLPWLVPVVAVVTVAGAVLGPHANPLHVAYRTVVAPRIAPPRVHEEPAAVRALDGLAAAACGLATLAFAGGLYGAGWVVALAEAAVAAVAASTGANAAVALRDRLRRR